MLVKKLGAKQILNNVPKIVEEHCKEVDTQVKAYAIWGTATGVKTGMSNYGEWTAFQGNFEAANYISGEDFQAPQCFIPEPLQSMLKNALSEHETIDFAFSVHIKRTGETSEDYEYIVEPHKEVQESDPLQALRALIPDLAPALEAPKAAPKKAAKSK